MRACFIKKSFNFSADCCSAFFLLGITLKTRTTKFYILIKDNAERTTVLRLRAVQVQQLLVASASIAGSLTTAALLAAAGLMVAAGLQQGGGGL